MRRPNRESEELNKDHCDVVAPSGVECEVDQCRDCVHPLVLSKLGRDLGIRHLARESVGTQQEPRACRRQL